MCGSILKPSYSTVEASLFTFFSCVDSLLLTRVAMQYEWWRIAFSFFYRCPLKSLVRNSRATCDMSFADKRGQNQRFQKRWDR